MKKNSGVSSGASRAENGKGRLYARTFKDGLIDRNPIFGQMLGLCPALAVTTTVMNGIGMGLATTFVLVFSGLFISLLRKFISPKTRIVSFIVIISGFVAVAEMFMLAYTPALAESLGIYVPLIVVNCLVLGRAENFASKNPPLISAADGLASGIGFTAVLVAVSLIRELLGQNSLFGFRIFGEGFSPALIFSLPAGGFLVLGFLAAFFRAVRGKSGEVD